MKSPNDLVLICGDFNLSSRELNPILAEKLVRENPAFIDPL
jgi:hypothetical protein